MSWNSEIGFAELGAIDDVLRGLLERGLGQAAGAAARLEAARGEARHLQVEAAPDLRVSAHEVLRRDEVVLEVERERVHAAVARRGVGLADDAPAAGLLHLELVPVEGVLGHDEEGQPPGALRQVGVGAREQREHVGATGERAPRLRTVDHPRVAAVHDLPLGPALDGGHVAADVGLGDRRCRP